MKFKIGEIVRCFVPHNGFSALGKICTISKRIDELTAFDWAYEIIIVKNLSSKNPGLRPGDYMKMSIEYVHPYLSEETTSVFEDILRDI